MLMDPVLIRRAGGEHSRPRTRDAMRLTHFTIKNYRSCIRTSASLHEKLTCFVGRNGAGKTSFLYAIQLLRELSSTTRLIHPWNKPSSRNQWSSELNAEFSIGGEEISLSSKLLFSEDRTPDAIEHSEETWSLVTRGGKKVVRLPITIFQYAFAPQDVIRSSHLFEAGPSSPTDGDITKIKTVANFVGRIRYYGASRFTDPSRAPDYFEIEMGRGQEPTLQTPHSRFVFNLYKVFNKEEAGFDEYKRIICDDLGLLKNIDFEQIRLPSNRIKVLQGGKIKTVEAERLIVIPHFELPNGKLVSPSQLSEGTFKTIALLFYLITEESRILLIEEPEVCVHHGLLDQVLDIIKSFSHRKQILISTHSEFVLDSLTMDNIMVVRNEAERGTVVKPLSKALSRNRMSALRRYLQSEGNLGEYLSHGSPDLFE